MSDDGYMGRLDDMCTGPVIGFVGRINPRQGVDVLFDAVEELRPTDHFLLVEQVGTTEDSSWASRTPMHELVGSCAAVAKRTETVMIRRDTVMPASAAKVNVSP